MKLTFLGGADEVGASCTLVEISGRRLLVDCGIRMTARAGDTIPWLAPIAESGGIDAIVVTHAHMDHTGALPVIHQSYPHIPLYMTACTLSLATILLNDSLKIMQSEMEQEGEIPLYPQKAVEMMLGAVRPVPMGGSLNILGGSVRLTFYPAGHIMGAAAVYIEGDDGNVMMSGDISVGDQKSIPGMVLPPVKPDVIVVESTYGGRLHASRTGEENRLIAQVGQILERQGSVLFPAFAVGRSQEVILLLSQAMEQNKIPEAPILIDGMVRQICQAYASYPELMTSWLRHKTKQRGHPFFYPGSPAQMVTNPRKREVLARQRPSVIVSSSGMLTGGPSPYYARALAEDPNCFIAITGYQDEESPGRQVQEVARAGGGVLSLGGQQVKLECGVGTYGLSAHADTAQIVSMVSGMQPREVALVHGDAGAREALKQALEQADVRGVHLPTMGYELTYTGPTRKSNRARRNAPQQPVPELHFDGLTDVAKTLRSRDGEGRLYTLQEIFLAWGDAEAAQDPNELDRLSRFVGAKSSPFRQDRKRPFLYKIQPDSSKKPTPKKQEQSGPMDPFNALKVVDSYLSEEQGLYKRSTNNNEQIITLSFHFPKKAASNFAETIESIAQQTGWEVTVRESPHHGALMDAAEQSLPEHWVLSKRPSIHPMEEKVVVTLENDPTQEEAHKAMLRFTETTGFILEFKGHNFAQPTEVSGATPSSGEANEAARTSEASTVQDRPSGGEAIASEYPPREAPEPMEINQTYHLIRTALQSAPPIQQPLKVGKKGDAVQIAFITPTVGETFAPLLASLSQHTGWNIEVRKSVDQHRLKEYAKQCIPEDWQLQKEPGFHHDTQTLSLVLGFPPRAEEFRDIASRFFEETGFKLELKRKK